MTALTPTTKVKLVNKAFSELMTSYMQENEIDKAEAVVKSFKILDDNSKVRLYDIMTVIK